MTPEDKDKITDSIMGAFDSMAEEGAEEGNIGEGVEDEPAEPTEPEEPSEPEGEEEEVEVKAEEQDTEEDTPEPETPAEPSEDEESEGQEEGTEETPEGEYEPAIQAYLDRHEGDIEKALATAVEIQKMLGRRNVEQGDMSRRIQMLEAELAQARALSDAGVGLTPEQAEWVGQALESEQPNLYIQSAVQAGEFDLARAVCDAWGENGDAYQALRTRQAVDQAEYHATQAQVAAEPPPDIPRDELLGMIATEVPDFPSYEREMVEIIAQLGDGHPMVIAAKSQDPNEAAMGLIDLYKVAQTRKARVGEARKQVEQRSAERTDGAKRRATVSSATSRTSAEEPPRPVKIGPGLTLEELDAAFAAE